MILRVLRILWVICGAFLGFLVVMPWAKEPLHILLGVAAGAFVGSLVILLELALSRHPIRSLVGAGIGLLLGLWAAYLILGSVQNGPLSARSFAPLASLGLLVLLGYLGWAVGLRKGEEWDPGVLPWTRRSEQPHTKLLLLDTSVIIDGRIADVCETGFLQGTIAIPQFILKELQQIADSSDPLKRARGRRGLDILKKIQDQQGMEVQFPDQDFPRIREVDGKLVELAKRLEAPIVTNDFNLNKIAELQGIRVLNINQLANALKPVVLPGELMRVRIIKEGKEQGQGVAYLDDGTMVVVDSAKKFMGTSIDVAVTSVLQTTAGRMIFTVVKDDAETQAEQARG